MCLSIISDKKPEPEGVGYKLMYKEDNYYKSEFSWGLAENYRLNSWYKSSMVISGDPLDYPHGFHIFTDKKHAKIWQCMELDLRIVKVAYRGAHTQGYQEIGRKLHVVVAKEMKIISED